MDNMIKFPIQVLFRNLRQTSAIRDCAIKHAEKLSTYFDHIMSCKITIETHRHHNKGKLYHIRIDLVIPHAELVVNRNPLDNHAHEDVYVAIRDACLAMKRQLQSYRSKQRGAIKHHEHPLEGKVIEISPLADYGLIETFDGRAFRFTSRSLQNYDFSKLEIGNRVTFVEIASNDGVAASTVYIA